MGGAILDSTNRIAGMASLSYRVTLPEVSFFFRSLNERYHGMIPGRSRYLADTILNPASLKSLIAGFLW